MISNISIKNFRSIVNADIGTNWMSTFVGANDAGKSNVLRALNLFFNGLTDPDEPFDFARDFSQFAKTPNRKAAQIEISINFLLPERYRREGFPDHIKWTKYWREEGEVKRMETRSYQDGTDFQSRSKIPALLDRIQFTHVPAIKDKAFFSDLQGRLYDVLASVAAEPLRESAANFEGKLQEQLGELLVSIEEVFAGKASMRLPENLRQIFENLEINSEQIPLSRRGDGIKIRHIPMILRFISEKRDQILNRGGVRFTHIWGFEEPENNVEMASAFHMADALHDLIASNHHYQLFLTTHSPIFYRLESKNDAENKWVTTHFVEKVDHSTTVVARSQSEVDESMGLMPILAPYLDQAKERYDQIQRELAAAKLLASDKLPTLFVEGPTDKKVMTKAFEVFKGPIAGRLRIYDGDDNYGSANALASRSLAWLLEMKHARPDNIVKAMAVFDADPAGSSAKKELLENIASFGMTPTAHFRAEALKAPQELGALIAKGFKIGVDLEALYSNKLWLHAKKRSWIAEVDNPAEMLGKVMLNQLYKGGAHPTEGLSDIELLRVGYKFTDEGKVKAAQYISQMSAEDFSIELAWLSPMIDKISEFLWPPA